MDFQLAFKRPLSSVRNYVIGSALALIPLVGGAFISGYAVKCAEKVEKKTPDWKPFGETFISGLIIWVISIVYFLLAGLLSLPFIIGIIFSAVSKNYIAIAILAVPIALLMILLLYILPSTLVHYAKTNQMTRAFNFGSVIRLAFTKKYFLATVLSFVVIMILAMISAPLGFLSSYLLENVGWGAYLLMLLPAMVVGAILKFYQYVFVYSLFGQTWKK